MKPRRKFLFCWTHESLYRAALDRVLSAPATRSLRWLGGGRLAKNIFLSARYSDFLLRTARDEPEKARSEDLYRSYSFLQEKVGLWLAGWRSVNWSDALLIDVQFVDWIVDGGVEMQINTAFVATPKVTVVCLGDEMDARGDIFEVDRRLLETERRHLGGGTNGTGELLL